jgi:hypothetical protein
VVRRRQQGWQQIFDSCRVDRSREDVQWSSAAHVPRHAAGTSAGQPAKGYPRACGVYGVRSTSTDEEDVLLAADRGNFAVVIHATYSALFWTCCKSDSALRNPVSGRCMREHNMMGHSSDPGRQEQLFRCSNAAPVSCCAGRSAGPMGRRWLAQVLVAVRAITGRDVK